MLINHKENKRKIPEGRRENRIGLLKMAREKGESRGKQKTTAEIIWISPISGKQQRI